MSPGRFQLSRWLLFLLLVLPLSCSRREGAPSAGSSPPAAGARGQAPAGDTAGQLVYEQLDVGQGDAELIVSPDGHAMLVDGGPPGKSETIAEALRTRRVERLDYVVASHPHNDHIGSLDDVVRQVPVGQFLDSGFEYGSDAQRRLLTAIKDRRMPFKLARPGQSYSLGERVTFTILAPRTPLLKGTDSDPNNNSVVLKLTFGDVRFLLTGDLEGDGRQRLYEENADLAAEVYKVSHHGSRNGTDREFLDRIRPRVAIISCEVGNDYGHPHVEALQALSSAGGTLYRTDLQGTVTLTTDGRTWQVRTTREAAVAVTIPGREIRSAASGAGAARTGSGSRGQRDGLASGMGGRDAAPGSGPIIGNRRSKVYHVGGGERLPALQNRVYFQTETEARRAGYRPARGGE